MVKEVAKQEKKVQNCLQIFIGTLCLVVLQNRRVSNDKQVWDEMHTQTHATQPEQNITMSGWKTVCALSADGLICREMVQNKSTYVLEAAKVETKRESH